MVHLIATDIYTVTEDANLLEKSVEGIAFITHETVAQVQHLYEAMNGLGEQNRLLNEKVVHFSKQLSAFDAGIRAIKAST